MALSGMARIARGNFQSLTYIQEIRMQCREISHDLIILGQLQAYGNNSDSVLVESRHKATSRECPYFAYHHQGKQICLRTFLFLSIL